MSVIDKPLGAAGIIKTPPVAVAGVDPRLFVAVTIHVTVVPKSDVVK